MYLHGCVFHFIITPVANPGCFPGIYTLWTPSRIYTVEPTGFVMMYNLCRSVLPDPAFRSRTFPTVSMLSVTGHPPEYAWFGGSLWVLPHDLSRQFFAQCRLLSSFATPLYLKTHRFYWEITCFVNYYEHFPAGYAVNPLSEAAGYFPRFMPQFFIDVSRPEERMVGLKACFSSAPKWAAAAHPAAPAPHPPGPQWTNHGSPQ